MAASLSPCRVLGIPKSKLCRRIAKLEGRLECLFLRRSGID
jgi:hypothetical protein